MFQPVRDAFREMRPKAVGPTKALGKKAPPLTSAPRTLPLSLHFPDKDVQAAFESAIMGHLDSDRKSNASLDAKTIAALAQGIIFRHPEIVDSCFISRATFFRAEYTLRSTFNPLRLVLVSVTSCKDATAAQQMMVDYLGTAQAAVQKVTKRAENQLGQVALQSDTSVFWVRDALWVQVIAEYESATALLDIHSLQDYHRSHSNLFESRNTDPIKTLLLEFAAKVDAHLAQNAVSLSEQKRPNTAVDRSSFKVMCGESFSVRLRDAFETHEFRRAEVKDPPLVMQTANKDPSAVGEYTFFAKNPGSTTLTLIVVRADNLAVDTAELQVEIADRQGSEVTENTDVESWKILDELLAIASERAKST